MTAQLSPPSLAQPKPPAGGLRPLALFSKAVRLALILAIAGVGLVLVQTYRELLHDSPAAPVQERKPPAAEGPGELPSSTLLQPGAWSLGESSWALRLTDLTEAPEEAMLPTLGYRGPIEGKASELEKRVLAWMRQARPTSVDGCSVYVRQLPGIRLRAVTRKQGNEERLQLVQALWSIGLRGQLLQACPAPLSGQRPSGDAHLLPVPAGTTSLARRWTATGELSCEVLGLNALSLEDAVKEWSAAGWSPEPLPPGEPSFRVVRKGSRLVQLWSLPGSKQPLSRCVLLATPSTDKQGAP
jgi:hypothetical protein